MVLGPVLAVEGKAVVVRTTDDGSRIVPPPLSRSRQCPAIVVGCPSTGLESIVSGSVPSGLHGPPVARRGRLLRRQPDRPRLLRLPRSQPRLATAFGTRRRYHLVRHRVDGLRLCPDQAPRRTDLAGQVPHTNTRTVPQHRGRCACLHFQITLDIRMPKEMIGVYRGLVPRHRSSPRSLHRGLVPNQGLA